MMTQPEPATSGILGPESEVGSVFVANYPPFSFWDVDSVPAVERVLDEAPAQGVPLGLYLHVPFCRKRCHFCYFRVYTGKNSAEVGRYLDAVAREAQLYGERAAIRGRPLRFLYFGGGTPSFLSEKQLGSLVRSIQTALPFDAADEVTFECEPGTLSRAKLEAIRGLGVTRLSLGIESFDDEVLRRNGRAHLSREIDLAWGWIGAVGFPQVNVDLIAGMLGESEESWRAGVRRTLELAPDSVTIYQMELPYNTRFTRQLKEDAQAPEFSDWATKRAWHDHAFAELARAGYSLSSAYTMVRDPTCRFLYRDSVWEGCDLLGIGVASFSHLRGVHFQNVATWGEYLEAVEGGRLPLARAFTTTSRERLTRELILQLKRGRLDPAYFAAKFGGDALASFAPALRFLEEAGMLDAAGGEVRVTRQGLLQVDRLLPAFYEPQYRHARYT